MLHQGMPEVPPKMNGAHILQQWALCAGDLALALDGYSIGDTVALKVQRGAGDAQGGQELEVTLKLEDDML